MFLFLASKYLLCSEGLRSSKLLHNRRNQTRNLHGQDRTLVPCWSWCIECRVYLRSRRAERHVCEFARSYCCIIADCRVCAINCDHHLAYKKVSNSLFVCFQSHLPQAVEFAQSTVQAVQSICTFTKRI